jgi:hypothetical protein
MNLTNLNGLPDAFAKAVRNDSYVGGQLMELSATHTAYLVMDKP